MAVFTVSDHKDHYSNTWLQISSLAFETKPYTQGLKNESLIKADHDYKSSLQQIAFFEKWFIQTQTTVPSRLRF
jgi:hypothetical protein